MTTIPPIEKYISPYTGVQFEYFLSIDSVNAHHEAIKKELKLFLDNALIICDLSYKQTLQDIIDSIGQVKK